MRKGWQLPLDISDSDEVVEATDSEEEDNEYRDWTHNLNKTKKIVEADVTDGNKNQSYVSDEVVAATDSEDEDSEYRDLAPGNNAKNCVEADVTNAELARPRKRKKVLNPRPMTKGKRRARLAVLPSMPLDILFELTRANKALNNILMSRSAKFVWTSTRRNIPRFPKTPSDMSDWAWFHLIFETNCHGPECTKKGIRRIDWALRQNTFNACFLLMKTHIPVGGWAGHKTSSRFYWMPAIWAMWKSLNKYEKNIQLRQPGAAAALHSFKKAQAAGAARAVKYVSVCEAWKSDAAVNNRTELRKLSNERLQEVTARFVSLGWNPEHLWGLEGHNLVRQSKLLTERVWANIRPKLEKELQERRYHRRRRQIEGILRDYTTACTASQRAAIFEMNTVKAIVTADGTQDMSALELTQLHQFLPTVVAECMQQKVRLDPNGGANPYSSPGVMRAT
ncbi:hypothetical protein BD410DRAFT_836117 [Rickenella mellea]|uniref:F-box domain-containing protein n=1 Tax=Rickenella mellea TaxID=50990 RepID=A0A4Y7QIG3_9AGAM|nr:hypothetical protein BD410DRAFT_836117 [Rickenella mellea]